MNNDTMYFVIITVLLMMIVGQHVFYSFQVHKLLNKVMSRDYAEYRATQEFKSAPVYPQGIQVKLPDEAEQEDLRALNQMISQF